MDTKPEQLPDSSPHLSYRPDYEPQTAVPPPFQEKTALAHSHDQTWATRPARPRLLGLLPAAAVIITTFGFVAVILIILLHFQCVETQGGEGILPAIRKGAFYTIETHKPSKDSKLLILTISTAANQVVSGTSAIVMALVAYRVGAEWLRLSKSQSNQSPAETPSPAQYGMLVRLLGSSSVLAIVEAFVYTARTWNRARLPRIFRHSMWLATIVWVLARLVGLADLWLHWASVSERFNVTLDEPPSPMPLWGVSFNQSICADINSTFKDSISRSPPGFDCIGPYQHFISEVAWGHNIAFEVMTNSTNAAFHVGIVENDTAFVFPGPGVVNMGVDNFVIPTFATRATCTSLNRVCADPYTNSLDCTAVGYPNFPYRGNGTGSAGEVEDRVLGVIGNDLVGKEQGTWESVDLLLPSNPVKLAVQLQWETLEQGPAPHPPAGSGASQDLAVDNLSHPTLYAGCNLTFFDAFVRWESGKQHWSLLNTTESSQERAATLWLPIVWQYATELIASNLMYIARRSSTAETMFALSQELATLTLATAAGFYKPGTASEVSDTEPLIVEKYPVLPIAAFLLLLCAYGLMTSVILLQVYRTPDEAIIVPGSNHGLLDEETEPSMLSLAQRWLTNPLPLVGHSFTGGDGRDGTRSAAHSAINTAYDGNEGHTRLTIGLVGDRFGVTSWGQR